MKSDSPVEDDNFIDEEDLHGHPDSRTDLPVLFLHQQYRNRLTWRGRVGVVPGRVCRRLSSKWPWMEAGVCGKDKLNTRVPRAVLVCVYQRVRVFSCSIGVLGVAEREIPRTPDPNQTRNTCCGHTSVHVLVGFQLHGYTGLLVRRECSSGRHRRGHGA